MALWDVVECDFNSADETINFGTRAITDGDNLYEASTLAIIKCSDDTLQADIKPHVNAVAKNERLFCSVDNTLKVFEDNQCVNLCFNGTFDYIVDKICVSSNGLLAVVCMRNGIIHCIKIGEESQIVFSNATLDNTDRDQMFYVGVYSEMSKDQTNFLIISRIGEVIRFCVENDNQSEENATLNFSSTVIKHFDTDILHTAYFHPNLFLYGTEMSVYNLVTEDFICDETCDLKLAHSLNNMVIGLLNSGEFIKICCNTLFIFFIKPETLYSDFLIVRDEIKCENSNIIAVTKENESGISYLQLISCKDFSITFSLKVPKTIYLVNLGNIHDQTMFISEMCENDKNGLRIQAVYETIPEKHLQRLLKKKRFEEAEKFAKTFHLDVNLIKRSKAELIVDQNEVNTKEVSDLLIILKDIDDTEFSLNCCSNIHYSCTFLDDVGRILRFGCASAQSVIEYPDENISTLASSMQFLMYRFDTFMTLARINPKKYDASMWLNFSSCNVIEEIKSYLEKYSIEEAIVIFNRLDTYTVKKITEEDIKDILKTSERLPIKLHEPFLKNFIPLSLSYFPLMQLLFIKWMHKRILYIEEKYSADFPENAIHFIEKHTELLKMKNNSIPSQELVKSLLNTTKALYEIQILKSNFNVTISLEDYLKGPRSLIINLLSLGWAEEEYYSFLQGFLSKLCVMYNLSPDEIYYNGIRDIVQYEQKYWIKLAPSIIKSISSTEIKLKAILCLLDTPTLPWCETLRQLATKALDYFHPLVEEIKKKIDNESVQLILNYPVYKFPIDSISDLDDLKFAIKRILYCKEPTMVNDIYKLCKTKNEKNTANLLLIDHHIKIGRINEGLKILDENSQEEIRSCCQSLKPIILDYTNQKQFGLPLQQNFYFNIAGSVFNRLKKFTKSKFEHDSLEKTLHSIRSVKKMKEIFNINTNAQTLQSFHGKKLLLGKLLQYMVENFHSTQIDIVECINLCNIIANCLSMENDDILLKFCEKLGSFDVLVTAANEIYINSSNSKNLCLAAILILTTLGKTEHDVNFSQFNITLSTDNLQEDVRLTLDGLKLADKLVIKAILNAVDDIDACVEVMKWIQTTFYIVRSGTENNIFHGNYKYEDVIATNSTFDSIKHMFILFSNYKEIHSNPNTRYLTNYTHNTPKIDQEQLLCEVKKLPLILQDLCMEGQNLTAYKLLITFYNGLINTQNLSKDILEELNNKLINKCTTNLLQNIISSQCMDNNFVFHLLLLYDLSYVQNFITKSIRLYKRNLTKLRAIAEIGLKVYNFHGMQNNTEIFVRIIDFSNWWKKIDNCRVSYDDFFKSDTPDSLLEKLLLADQINIKLLREYCVDFNLDLQNNYSTYLKHILVTWKPNYEIKTDINGRRTLIVNNNENLLFEKCREVICLIENKNMVEELINNLWNVINFYHYEVFICILEILKLLQKDVIYKKQSSLLSFLKNYTRVNKPSQTEMETWFTVFPETQNLDFLSEWRFPYTYMLFTNNIWKIIGSEINLKTYKAWFVLTDVFNHLKKDDICSYAVKSVVSSGILENNTEEWNIYQKHEELINEIDICCQHIVDYEKTSSVTYYLMTHTAKGADQVATAKLCYKYVLLYKNNCQNSIDIEKVFIKVQKKYERYSIMQVLYKYNLPKPKYLNMASSPLQLIETLYMDNSILKSMKNITYRCADVNKIVDEIAALTGIDIDEKRKELVKGWLFDFMMSNNTTIISNSYEQFPDIDDDNLDRAAYVCSSDLPWWQKYLLEIGLNDEPTNSNNKRQKARALKCFCKISDPETILELTGDTYNSFIIFVTKMCIISDLEQIGITLDINLLNDCNKSELIHKLVQRINPIRTRIMYSICTTYGIYNMKYWKLIINSANKFNMIKELKDCVTFLKNNFNFHHKDFYIAAWQKLLNVSFKSCNNYSGDELQKCCVNNIHQIQTCPVLYSLNFQYAINVCVELQLHQFTAVLIQYLPAEEQQAIIEQLRQLPFDTIKKIISDLRDYGLWGVTYIESVLM